MRVRVRDSRRCSRARPCLPVAPRRHMGSARAERHTPGFAKAIVAQYDAKGEVAARLALQPGKSGRGG